MKVIEKPVEIEQGDSFKIILSKYGALALDKQENLSELIGETVGDLDIENGIVTFGDIEFPAQVLGFYMQDANQWSWAWDNEDIFGNELIEAAKIDGCNPFTTFLQICFPLAKSTIATLAIFCFMGVWNAYFSPLVYLNDIRKYTLPLGLASMKGLYSTDWPVLMAASLIAVIPVLIAFLLAQDAFVKGVMMSGMKD